MVFEEFNSRKWTMSIIMRYCDYITLVSTLRNIRWIHKYFAKWGWK